MRAGQLRHTQSVGNTDVTRHTHLRNVEAFDLRFWISTEADDDIDEFEYDETKDADGHDISAYADTLCHELRSIAVEESPDGTRDPIPAVAIRSVRKQTKRKATPCAITR